MAIPFMALLALAQQAVGLIGDFKAKFAAAKDALTSQQIDELQAALDEIHEANLSLSGELDAALAAAANKP